MRPAEVTRSRRKLRRVFSSSFFVLLVALVCTRVLGDDDLVEFRLPEYNEVISIPVTVGNAKHLCVLDSGATAHFFHTSLRETLGKQRGETTVGAADGERINLALYSVPDIKVGRITLQGSKISAKNDETNNFALHCPRTMLGSSSLFVDVFDPLEDNGENEERVGCCDLTLAPQASGRNIEGVIGMPLFLARVIQLDFDHRCIRILPATTAPSGDWGEPINVSFDNSRMPKIDVELPDGVNATCTVDTGFDGAIAFSSELFAKLTDARKISPEEDEPVFLLGGLKVVHTGKLAGAKIGSFVCADLRVGESGTQNRIGLQYLRRFLVTLDLGRNRIYLKKGAAFDAPDKGRAVSLGLLRKNDRHIVGFIGRNSRAQRAGIQINDELISVGGESVRGKPNAEIRWLYREKADANGHLTLAMRRDGVERNVDVEINK